VISVVLVLLTALLVCQYGNLESLFLSVKYTDKELADQIEASKGMVNDVLPKYNDAIVRDFTLAEEEQIRKGEITPEEAVALLSVPLVGGEAVAEEESLAGKHNDQTQETLSSQKQQDAVIGRHIASMYSLKSSYLAKLGELEREAVAEYLALPEAEQNTMAKEKIIAENLRKAAALEQACDQQVDQVLSNLRQDLQSFGGNLDIVDTLKEAYRNEKSLKKAYYMKRFN